MSFLFGGTPPTTAELAAHFRTRIHRSVREIDREAARLRAEERGLMVEIKRAAGNNLKQALQKAKAVVRTRRTLNRVSAMKSHFQGVAARIQNVKSMTALQGAMDSAARMMQQFNRSLGGRALCASLADLQRQNAAMNMHSELMDEGMDEAFDEDEDADDVDNVVSAVLLEAGIKLPDSMRAHGAEDLTLEERFDRLLPPVPAAAGRP